MKRPGAVVLLGLCFGAITLMNIAASPRFEAFHAVDVVRLIAAGMCFGVALVGIILLLRKRH
ncbi:MAG: hypothetical protein NTY38_24760 [Acidobacteria bacterium]|nr:hypothetical protein [Acidobacteriota bacterium]